MQLFTENDEKHPHVALYFIYSRTWGSGKPCPKENISATIVSLIIIIIIFFYVLENGTTNRFSALDIQ